ncbi:MAG TPA: 16S rRNA (adenine(1518)-N(6)/adenine(1519)-N(6))-dimethyltransferase RsmA, partial [bacterium]
VPLKKSLSQHFLADLSVAARMVESMAIDHDDRILEIGPGDGRLTEWLLRSSAGTVLAVELDKRFSSHLLNRFGNDDRFHLIQNDFLKIELTEWARDKKLRIVGNLPYAITSPILFRMLENRSEVSDATVTVQKEVAERVTSPPGSKAYGIPSVFFQLYAQTKILFGVPRNAFHPVPNVDSAVLKIDFLSEPAYTVRRPDLFQKVVKTAFGQRRKMLRNTLKPLLRDESIWNESPVDLSKRPEQLTVWEFVRLTDFISGLPSSASSQPWPS